MDDVKEGYIDVQGGKVWYKFVSHSKKNTPLIILHGGPGFPIDSMLVLEQLAEDRGVLFYDQLGAGRSDRPKDTTLWNLNRFVDELSTIRDRLNLQSIHLLGHSWGSMLAASYLLTKPNGVKSVIFSSPCLDTKLWTEDQLEYRKQLPENIQEVLNQCELLGDTDSDEYHEALMIFYTRHVCRLTPWPESLMQSIQASNSEIYKTMWGPSELFLTGNLKDFDFTHHLKNISTPSLFLCGRYDEATPKTTKYYSQLTKTGEFHMFENSSHMAFLEEPDKFKEIVNRFIKKHDN